MISLSFRNKTSSGTTFKRSGNCSKKSDLQGIPAVTPEPDDIVAEAGSMTLCDKLLDNPQMENRYFRNCIPIGDTRSYSYL